MPLALIERNASLQIFFGSHSAVKKGPDVMSVQSAEGLS